jgi:hypothetical protein
MPPSDGEMTEPGSPIVRRSSLAAREATGAWVALQVSGEALESVGDRAVREGVHGLADLHFGIGKPVGAYDHGVFSIRLAA